MMQKNVDPIHDFYFSLTKGEKGRFLAWAMLQTDRGQTTVISRLKDGRWSPMERAGIERAIAEGSWCNTP